MELHQLSGLDLRAGRLEDARTNLTDASAMAEKLGAEAFVYFMRTDLTILLLIVGQHEEAAPLVRRCLLMARRIGLHLDVSELLFGAACCAAWQGDHVWAARLHGAADKDLSTAIAVGSITWTGPERQLTEREQGSLRQIMGDEAYDAAYRSGAGLSRAQAVDLALGREVLG
jgi:non-specific serine/threonine protein kinase